MKVGIIGYGSWGSNLVRNLAEVPNAEIAWCSAKRPDRRARAKKRYPYVNVTGNVDDLLDDPELDAIVTKDASPRMIVAGNPARVLGKMD